MTYVLLNKNGVPRKERVLPTMDRRCEDCAAVYVGVYNNKCCPSCRAERIKPKPRKYPNCLLCSMPTTGIGPAKFCKKCAKSRRRAYWTAEKHKKNQNERARQLTKHAINLGFLPHYSHYKCVDCKQTQAQCYDHRDYSKPLSVEPVCLRCNSSRGAGVAVQFPCVEYVTA